MSASHGGDESMVVDEGGPVKTVLTLYVTGRVGKSQVAITTVEELCAELIEGPCELEVIDLLEHPSIAESNRVLATPTIVRESPTPQRKLVGDINNAERVLDELQLPRKLAGDEA